MHANESVSVRSTLQGETREVRIQEKREKPRGEIRARGTNQEWKRHETEVLMKGEAAAKATNEKKKMSRERNGMKERGCSGSCRVVLRR